jgi:hypothetical protein
VLCHLNHPLPILFAWVIFEIWPHFLPGLAWTVVLLCFHMKEDEKHMPLCLSIIWDGVWWTFLYLGLHQPTKLPISASQEARSTGLNHCT